MLDHSQVLAVAKEAASLAGRELLKFFVDPNLEMRDKTASGGVSYDLVSDADLTAEKWWLSILLNRFPITRCLAKKPGNGHGRRYARTLVDHRSAGRHQQLCPSSTELCGVDRLLSSRHRAGRRRVCAGTVAVVYRCTWSGRMAQRSASTRVGASAVIEGPDRLWLLLRSRRNDAAHAGIDRTVFWTRHPWIRRFGAASLDLCMVGCGQFGGFFEYRLSPWDFAAGRLFIEEAGGKVTTATGAALELKPTSVVASNGALHDAMLKITIALLYEQHLLKRKSRSEF